MVGSGRWILEVSPEDFIMALKLRMKQSQVSQNRLARQTGIQPQHVSKYMQGKLRPSLRTMIRLWRGVRALEREEGR